VPTKDDFTPDNPLSLNDKKQRVKASILLVTVIAVATSQLSGNLLKVFADVAASPVHKSTSQPGTDLSAPIIQSAVIQSTADAGALPPHVKDAPIREIGAASEPASQTQTENSAPSSEALFRQFQAWAAEQAARVLIKPVQDARALVVENAPTPARPTQKHRRVRSESNRAQDQYVHLRFSD